MYLGSEKQALSRDVVDALQITHIVNASKAIKNAHEPDITYMNAYVTDIETDHIDDYFLQAYEFIHEALSNPLNRVLVHCGFGVSRSASLVIMYLMKRWEKSYDEAYNYTKSCREIIEPNEGFKTQLMKFESNRKSFWRHGSAVVERTEKPAFIKKITRSCA